MFHPLGIILFDEACSQRINLAGQWKLELVPLAVTVRGKLVFDGPALEECGDLSAYLKTDCTSH